MNDEPISTPPVSGMKLGDIYYVLFRHKWKIILISVIGLLVAVALPFVLPRPYQSEAKIFIRYVLEGKSPAQDGGDSRMKSPDEGGASIINSEVEILTSLDLAQQVADAIGPDKILGKTGVENERVKAAKVIHDGLAIAPPQKSSVIDLTFKHRNPAIVQQVLNELVESYFKRHAEVHRAVGVFDDFLARETDQLRSRLVQTENALRAAKTNAGVISLEETKRSFGEELSRIRLDIFAAEAELAQRKATIEEMTRLSHNQVKTSTNDATDKSLRVIPPEKMAEYRRVSNLLTGLNQREQELLVQFTPENTQVKSIEAQISTAQELKERLETEEPGLLGMVVEARPTDTVNVSRFDLQTEMAIVAALASKIEALTNQLASVRKDAASVDAVEGSITELQRKKELEETNYKYYAAKLEESRIDEAIGSGRVSNISTIQAPSPPFRDNKKLIKIMVGTCIGSVVAALALAFLIELYLDPSIKRPSQVRSQLPVPLFVSIPRLSLNGKSRALESARRVPLLAAQKEDGPSGSTAMVQQKPVNGTVAPWDGGHPLRPFFETLRDRLILFFEEVNLVHKPKLVAVTSCGDGAGVSTTAAGLAACLSETGEGNVLLVDMNVQQGAAHHFYKGHLGCGIDEALQRDKRDNALVQENLYVVTDTADGEKLPQILPKRFKHLIPKLRASDYDYIIFDMPAMSQISSTPRLAQFMDMIFLVVESEKTDREIAKRAATLLSESASNVGIVLNKTKTYVPKRLQQDL